MIEKNCSIGGATEDWVLLVEPIVYLSICKGNSEGRIKDVVPGTTKLYGTVSNIMDAFMSIPNLRGYANRQTFNYKAMKEWWQALTVRDDTETTFEEYRKKNKGTKGGTGPALITVPDDEKVLYLKLVRYDWAEYEPITVIKVKEPADGSDPIIEKGTTSPGTYPAAETGWEYKQDIQTPDPEKSVSRWSDVILHSQTLP